MSNRIVIGGPSNCGKSTLAASVFQHLKSIGVDVGLYELDTFSDTLPCILGQKSWEARQKRPWGNWEDPLIEERLREFFSDSRELVIGDLPGIIDELQERLVRDATAAIVVGKNGDGMREWGEFFAGQRIPVILTVVSHLNGDGDYLSTQYPNSIIVKDLNRMIIDAHPIRIVAHRLKEVCMEPVFL